MPPRIYPKPFVDDADDATVDDDVVEVADDVVDAEDDLPHVDKVLGQGNGLAVAGDGDGPVHVGRCVPVLAV